MKRLRRKRGKGGDDDDDDGRDFGGSSGEKFMFFSVIGIIAFMWE